MVALDNADLKRVLENHRKWLNGEEDGERADLLGADLREADVDFSAWPLWCGSLGVRVVRRIAAQIAYHFCRLDCDDPEYLAAREALAKFANTFHRVDECGRIAHESHKD